MKIENNKVVSLTYHLKENDENGKTIEETNENTPLVFLFGQGSLIPGFEKNVKDLKVDDTFAFAVKPEEGYGEYTEKNVADIPIEVFMIDGKLDKEAVSPGKMLSLQGEEGKVFNGKVEKVGEKAVTMDFNHPLAGKTLHFSGKVLDIRDASEEEISHGHVHGPHGHHH